MDCVSVLASLGRMAIGFPFCTLRLGQANFRGYRPSEVLRWDGRDTGGCRGCPTSRRVRGAMCCAGGPSASRSQPTPRAGRCGSLGAVAAARWTRGMREGRSMFAVVACPWGTWGRGCCRPSLEAVTRGSSPLKPHNFPPRHRVAGPWQHCVRQTRPTYLPSLPPPPGKPSC